ncbi:MAG: TspO/MBR family protein [Streptosporangiaceae bacterium]
MTVGPYLATGAATCAAALIGGAGTAVGSQWYTELDRPSWQPPGEVIGAVWTGLYASIAAATGRATAKATPERRRRIAALLGVNLAINAAWPWVFFRARRPVLGVAVIGALEASTIALTREVGKADRVAGAALAPYLGWNLFAMTLNATIARRNRRRSR